MENTQTLFDRISSSLSLLLDKMTTPNPRFVDSNKVHQEFTNRRNKTFIVVHATLLLTFILETICNRNMAFANFYKGFLLCLHLLMMYLSCRFHPHIFKIYYTFIAATYGLGVIDTGEEGIHTAIFAVLMVPMYVYLFMGSIWYYLFQVCVQLVFVKYYYAKIFEEMVSFMTPESFTRAMVYACYLTVMFLVVLVFLTHYLMHQAYQRLLTTELKKDEFENQKTFLLSFSHELRNLINSLIGNVTLASLESINERAKELLLNAEVCGELLVHLVNNILDTGKVEIGELEINPAPTRIYATLEKIWGVCSELIKRKGLNGSLKVQRDLPKILLTDHYRMTQIFLNLVGNAIKYTDRGSVDITVEWIADKNQVDEKCFHPIPFNYMDDQDEGIFEKKQMFTVFASNMITLSTGNRKFSPSAFSQARAVNSGVLKVVVRDSGCGISKDDIQKLFNKFTQMTSDASKTKLGTGLGLFISRQICQRMNGEIKVFSKEDKGSAFIFCIPMQCGKDEQEHLYNIDSLKKSISSKKLSSMLVDDITFNHVILKNFFDKLDIEVLDIAVNGLEAIQKYNKQITRGDRPQIVTMDLDMPIMDGKEASAKIRQIEIEKNLKPCILIIISGNCTDSEIKECIDKTGPIRANGFLKKPVNIEDLTRAIGSSFDQL